MTEPDTDPAEAIEPVESPAEAAPVLLGEASQIWVEICNFYGGPHELYGRGFDYPRSHRLAADWIRCLEILVRRIILIMAMALDLPQRAAAGAVVKHTRTPAPKKPFRAHRPVFTVMPPVPPPNPEPDTRQRTAARPLIKTWRSRALARRLDALFLAIRYSEAYARRTALSLARIATLKREPERPLVGLRRWWVHPSKRTSGEERTYDLIERAQSLAQHGLNAWHARLPHLDLADPRPLEPG